MAIFIHHGASTFELDRSADAGAVAADIQRAVQAGSGALLAVPTAKGEVLLLLGPQIPVSVEVVNDTVSAYADAGPAAG